jgi:GNAT superfamily N-acetyltransferase
MRLRDFSKTIGEAAMANVEIVMLETGNEVLLRNVAADVFDNPVDSRLAAEFVRDSRHHMAVAIDDGQVVGMASGVHYVHPDKSPELWVNEVAVSPAYRGQGVGRRLVERLCRRGRELGCVEAWVLTDHGNPAAMRMYAGAGGVEHPVPVAMFEFKLAADEPV